MANENILKEINRRLESIERYAELIYKDRDLIKDIQGEVQASGNEVKATVIEKSEDVKAKVDEVKEDTVKGLFGTTKNHGILQRIFRKKKGSL